MHAHAGRPFLAEDAARVVQVNQRQRRIVFIVAGAEGARHRHLLHARGHAHGRDLSAGGQQRQRVALGYAQRARQIAPQDDAELPRLQPRQHAIGLQLRGHFRHLRFFGGVDAADGRAFHRVAARQQPLLANEGGCAGHLAFLGAFDFQKFAFVPYEAIADVFSINDFNWNVTPSNHESKEFALLKTRIEAQLKENAYLFDFEKDVKELRYFIEHNVKEATNKAKQPIEKGKMNNKSTDERYNTLIGNLREALGVLAQEIEVQVYAYGFLL